MINNHLHIKKFCSIHISPAVFTTLFRLNISFFGFFLPKAAALASQPQEEMEHDEAKEKQPQRIRVSILDFLKGAVSNSVDGNLLPGL